MGLFGDMDLDKARTGTSGGVYIEPGEYVLEITDFKAIKTRSKGPMLAADFKVVTSTNESRPAGMRVNYVILTDQDWGPGNLKELMIASSGLDPFSPNDAAKAASQDWNAVLTRAIGDTQPYRGCLVNCVAVHKNKVKSSGVFTRVMFTPHPTTREKFGIDKAKK